MPAKDKKAKRRRRLEKKKRGAAAKASYEEERRGIEGLLSKAPYYKAILRHRGCQLPFYEYLDSYEGEFRRLAESAVADRPSLLGVHEVEDDYLFVKGRNWSRLGYEEVTPWSVDTGKYEDYGVQDERSGVIGAMCPLSDANGELRTVILIRKRPPPKLGRHREHEYMSKLLTLIHEIGHVTDIEQGINIERGRFDVIEAEVYANLYAFDWLARRPAPKAYDVLTALLEGNAESSGYNGEVSAEVLSRKPKHDIPDWTPVILASQWTDEELEMIGETGRRAIEGKN